MIPVLVLLGVAIASVAVYQYAIRHEENERQRALRYMQDRPSLDPAEFGSHYFPPAQAEIAGEVAAIFAKHICIDISRVHPDDQLVEDLRMDALDSMSTLEFVLELEKHFKISSPNAAGANMRTLRDITSFITAKLQK